VAQRLRARRRRFATFHSLGRVLRAGSGGRVRSFFQQRSVLAQPSRSAIDRNRAHLAPNRTLRETMEYAHKGGASLSFAKWTFKSSVAVIF